MLNARFLGLLRLMSSRKKLISITAIFGFIFSIAGFLIPELDIGIRILIVSTSFIASFLIAVIYLLITALVAEKQAVKTMTLYLNRLENDYALKKEEFSLIDRKIDVGYPEQATWDFYIQNAIEWFDAGIKRNGHMFIEGQMGIGKTMLILSLTNKLASEAKVKLKKRKHSDIKFPILVPLGRSEFFPEKYLESDSQIGGEYSEWIKKQDWLDEVSPKVFRTSSKMFRKWLDKEYPY